MPLALPTPVATVGGSLFQSIRTANAKPRLIFLPPIRCQLLHSGFPSNIDLCLATAVLPTSAARATPRPTHPSTVINWLFYHHTLPTLPGLLLPFFLFHRDNLAFLPTSTTTATFTPFFQHALPTLSPRFSLQHPLATSFQHIRLPLYPGLPSNTRFHHYNPGLPSSTALPPLRPRSPFQHTFMPVIFFRILFLLSSTCCHHLSSLTTDIYPLSSMLAMQLLIRAMRQHREYHQGFYVSK